MKRPLFLLPVLVGLFLLTVIFSATKMDRTLALAAPVLTTPTPARSPEENDATTEQVRQAILTAIRAHSEEVMVFLIYQQDVINVRISSDGLWAVGLLVSNDPETGQPAHIEPGLALAKWTGEQWDVILPADSRWPDSVAAVPAEILSDEHKSAWLHDYQISACTFVDPHPVYSGYLLPWAAGITRYLSQSTGHDQYETDFSAHYAFDFYTPSSLWDIYAAKAGTVWKYMIWDVPTCTQYHCDDQPYGNRIVIQDTTTNPVSYQLYLHLAYDSIPQELRTVGAPVAQRQFIGVADNTGQSWGNHLHFQVHTNPDSYWGCSVDITFDDVTINGGRPRVTGDLPYCNKAGDVCSQTQSGYVSGPGGDGFPPYGGLFQPYTGQTFQTSIAHLEGYAGDDQSGLAYARFIAQYSGSWHAIGPTFTSNTFSYDWDMCADSVPDGPLNVALEVVDNSNMQATGLPGLTHLIKDYACPPPPTCTPTASQVALFADPNFGGTCTVLGVGSYPNSSSFSALGDDNVESLKVGANVLATLYSDGSYAGRGETFAANDSNLADNLIGANLLTSLKVQLRTQAPAMPSKLIAPSNGSAFADRASISLSWRDPGGATAFQAALTGPASLGVASPSAVITSPWLTEPVWHMDGITLTTGLYSWRVKSRNDVNESEWSTSTLTFTISAPTPTPTPVAVPFFDNVEGGVNGWTASGLWNRKNWSDRSHSPSYSWYYGNANNNYYDGANLGDLTSPPITLTNAGGNYLLEFWYRYQTEGPGRSRDQRWVQISRNGGAFTSLLQLYDDAPDYWLKATADLSDYAGDTVQIRFFFETLDGAFNKYEGWFVDDILVSEGALPPCGDNNDTPPDATPLNFGETVNEVICPAGDVDYFTFTGTAGDRIVVDVDTPEVKPGDLDLVLFLLDGDGASVLAESDDEVPGVLTDPHLGFPLTRSGTYYLKLRLWSHPSSGDDTYTYSLHLSTDNGRPVTALDYPSSGNYLPAGAITVTATASDTLSGISLVEFFWHSSDWLNEDWTLLGSDRDGSDGWKVTFTAPLTEQNDAALFINTYDWAGNWTGDAAWSLGIDRTSPTSTLHSLSAAQTSTAVLLEWSGSDNLSGVDYYNLQSKKGSASWVDYTPNPTATITQTWFIAEAGNTYGFRMRAVDVAGNSEAYPSTAETTTTLPAAATLCSVPDEWETDNDFTTANPLTPDNVAQTHNFCNPTTLDYLNDEDWLTFSAQAGNTYLIESTPQTGSVATVLELYAADGTTLLASATPTTLGEAVALSWKAPEDGDLYLRIYHLDGRIIGNNISYQIQATTYRPLFLPMIMR